MKNTERVGIAVAAAAAGAGLTTLAKRVSSRHHHEHEERVPPDHEDEPSAHDDSTPDDPTQDDSPPDDLALVDTSDTDSVDTSSDPGPAVEENVDGDLVETDPLDEDPVVLKGEDGPPSTSAHPPTSSAPPVVDLKLIDESDQHNLGADVGIRSRSPRPSRARPVRATRTSQGGPGGAADGSAIKPRRRLATASGAVSYLAVGAILTVLAVWGTGGFDSGPSQREVATAMRLDQAASEAPAAPRPARQQTAPLTGAQITEREDFVPPTVSMKVQRPNPLVVSIPAIGVDARIIPLETDKFGTLQTPENFAEAGWWTGGPEPGEVGPSVVAGHVDSRDGPAVFFALEELVYDDAITINRGDGSSAVFAVRSTLNVEKEEFPSDLVYGETDGAELRLITCDGSFADGSYLGNLIITAELVEEYPAPTSGLLYEA